LRRPGGFARSSLLRCLGGFRFCSFGAPGLGSRRFRFRCRRSLRFACRTVRRRLVRSSFFLRRPGCFRFRGFALGRFRARRVGLRGLGSCRIILAAAAFSRRLFPLQPAALSAAAFSAAALAASALAASAFAASLLAASAFAASALAASALAAAASRPLLWRLRLSRHLAWTHPPYRLVASLPAGRRFGARCISFGGRSPGRFRFCGVALGCFCPGCFSFRGVGFRSIGFPRFRLCRLALASVRFRGIAPASVASGLSAIAPVRFSPALIGDLGAGATAGGVAAGAGAPARWLPQAAGLPPRARASCGRAAHRRPACAGVAASAGCAAAKRAAAAAVRCAR
jgi:hypothetical protein